VTVSLPQNLPYPLIPDLVYLMSPCMDLSGFFIASGNSRRPLRDNCKLTKQFLCDEDEQNGDIRHDDERDVRPFG